jgi:hypothetical protein
MATSETCGNSYDKSIRIEMAGQPPTFDSVERAISDRGAHCARKSDVKGIQARA